MFVQSIEFIHAHSNGNGNGGKAKGDISIYGQESNYATWRLAKGTVPSEAKRRRDCPCFADPRPARPRPCEGCEAVCGAGGIDWGRSWDGVRKGTDELRLPRT